MDDWGKVKVQIYKHFLREPFLYYLTIITCFTFSLKRLLVSQSESFYGAIIVLHDNSSGAKITV